MGDLVVDEWEASTEINATDTECEGEDCSQLDVGPFHSWYNSRLSFSRARLNSDNVKPNAAVGKATLRCPLDAVRRIPCTGTA